MPASDEPASTGIDAVASAQRVLSAAPAPVHAPVHWPEPTHLPLGQSLSATQTHALWSARHTGAGLNVVGHEYVAAGGSR